MKSSVTKTYFGKLTTGTKVDLYTLINRNGLVAKITSYGTIITELHVPDKKGRLGDVVLGFDTLEQYLKGHPYFGCTVGRYANRIAKGRFTLDGRTYKLAVNNGPNALHGGLQGFDKVVWKATPLKGAGVKFTYTSVDGEEGYPGKVDATVVMALTDENELAIDYFARTTKPTPVNLTNHSYFNLACSGDIKGHKLALESDFYTPSDATNIPTGEIRSVSGTPFDFTKPKAMGSRFDVLGGKPQGYDHNYVLRGGGRSLALAARVVEPKSGRVMEVLTTEPGIQLYTANWFDGTLAGKGGWVYQPHHAFCLETQHYPDSPNKPHFPTTVLRPGQIYRQTTVYRFGVA
jgi:aldose 1-epimerase